MTILCLSQMEPWMYHQCIIRVFSEKKNSGLLLWLGSKFSHLKVIIITIIFSSKSALGGLLYSLVCVAFFWTLFFSVFEHYMKRVNLIPLCLLQFFYLGSFKCSLIRVNILSSRCVRHILRVIFDDIFVFWLGITQSIREDRVKIVLKQ